MRQKNYIIEISKKFLQLQRLTPNHFGKKTYNFCFNGVTKFVTNPYLISNYTCCLDYDEQPTRIDNQFHHESFLFLLILHFKPLEEEFPYREDNLGHGWGCHGGEEVDRVVSKGGEDKREGG